MSNHKNGQVIEVNDTDTDTDTDTEGKKVRTSATVSMPTAMYEHCEEFAKLNSKSLSHVVRLALRDYTAYQGDIGNDRERRAKLTEDEKEAQKTTEKKLRKLVSNADNMKAINALMDSLNSGGGQATDILALIAQLKK